MTLVTASIDIDAPREKVFETMLDPSRLDEWVTIHRKVNDADGGAPHEGYAMEQTLCLRGVNFKVKWKLTEFEPDTSRHLGGPRPRPLLRAHRLPALRPRRRRHALRVRERVQGARRVPRQGGLARDRGRRAPARGQPLARRSSRRCSSADGQPPRYEHRATSGRSSSPTRR